MKVFIFGSCSGTEPFADRHHTALALEVNGRIYWFDAGENCSHTAHVMGIDLLSVADIFISHGHMDHIGGLANLLWTIRKLSNVKKTLPRFGDITVYMPNDSSFDGVMTLLKNSEGNYEAPYRTCSKRITDSVLLKNEDIEVTAIHNHHLQEYEDGWKSFSFCIRAEGKKIVYSGDIKALDDIADFLKDGCDMLLTETGHHNAEAICEEIIAKNYQINSLCFLHHGRGILYDYEGTLERCRKIIPSVTICNDKDVFEL